MQNVIIILAHVTILLTFCLALKGVMLPVLCGFSVDLIDPFDGQFTCGDWGSSRETWRRQRCVGTFINNLLISWLMVIATKIRNLFIQWSDYGLVRQLAASVAWRSPVWWGWEWVLNWASLSCRQFYCRKTRGSVSIADLSTQFSLHNMVGSSGKCIFYIGFYIVNPVPCCHDVQEWCRRECNG